MINDQVTQDGSSRRAGDAAIALKNKRHRRYRNYGILLVTFGVYMTVCSLFYTYYENWEPSISMAFVVETMTTVGFGYHSPSDDRSRLFTIFAMVFGIFVIFGGISTALTNRLADFKNKRKYGNLDQIEEIHRDLHRRLVINLCAIVVSLFTAALIFYLMEDWTFVKALYFAVQTATSVGYGDIPLGQGGTHIAVGIYTFLSTILLAFAISNLTDVYKERKRLAKILAIAERKQALDCLKDLDAGNGVARDTFVLAVLEQLGILNRENDIEPWIKKFEQFDVNNTGVLRRTEIERFSASESVTGAAQVDRIRSMDENPGSPFDIRSTLVDAVGAGAGMLGMNGVAASAAAYNRRQSTRTAGAVPGGVAMGNAASAAAGSGAIGTAPGAPGKVKRNSAGSVNREVVSPFAAPVVDSATSYHDNL